MYIRVRVQPGAKKELVTKKSETEFYIMVKEKPERNFANSRVIELLASEFGIERKQIRLITGHRSSSKVFSIDTH